MLRSIPDSGLRAEREIKRIKDAVRKVVHWNWIYSYYYSAAELDDLFDGLSEHSPHIVHFSGHSDDTSILLEQGVVGANDGMAVVVSNLGRAFCSVDNPPTVLILNSCHSADHYRARNNVCC